MADDARTDDVRTGYKVVDADGQSLFGQPRVAYAVGRHYALPAGARPMICQYGFHYCPVALDCLRSVEFKRGYRLLAVSVPADADIVADEHDVKWAASAMDIVADVTADILRLLTGVLRPRPDDAIQVVRYYEAGLHHRLDGPALATRGEMKRWYRHGEPSALASVLGAPCTELLRVSADTILIENADKSQVRDASWDWVHNDAPTRWAAAVALLDADDCCS
jgi:hypothetical protein